VGLSVGTGADVGAVVLANVGDTVGDNVGCLVGDSVESASSFGSVLANSEIEGSLVVSSTTLLSTWTLSLLLGASTTSTSSSMTLVSSAFSALLELLGDLTDTTSGDDAEEDLADLMDPKFRRFLEIILVSVLLCRRSREEGECNKDWNSRTKSDVLDLVVDRDPVS
jgi:hypothetical protein